MCRIIRAEDEVSANKSSGLMRFNHDVLCAAAAAAAHPPPLHPTQTADAVGKNCFTTQCLQWRDMMQRGKHFLSGPRYSAAVDKDVSVV